MGFFDPPYVKILAKSPPEFAQLMQRLDAEFVAALRNGGVTDNGLDLCRNLIYSIIIPRVASRYGVFSQDVLTYAQKTGQNAYTVIPKRFIPLIDTIVHTFLVLMDRREEPTNAGRPTG